jgi:hypothetical protein
MKSSILTYIIDKFTKRQNVQKEPWNGHPLVDRPLLKKPRGKE